MINPSQYRPRYRNRLNTSRARRREERNIVRQADDLELRSHGWQGGAGSWVHPWLPGTWVKWQALIETKRNPKIKSYHVIVPLMPKP